IGEEPLFGNVGLTADGVVFGNYRPRVLEPSPPNQGFLFIGGIPYFLSVVAPGGNVTIDTADASGSVLGHDLGGVPFSYNYHTGIFIKAGLSSQLLAFPPPYLDPATYAPLLSTSGLHLHQLNAVAQNNEGWFVVEETRILHNFLPGLNGALRLRTCTWSRPRCPNQRAACCLAWE